MAWFFGGRKAREHETAQITLTLSANSQHAWRRSDEELRLLWLTLPRYRLLLYANTGADAIADDATGDSDKPAVSALTQVISTLTADVAGQALAEARAYGVAEVITCLREPAEYYCEQLRRRGVRCGLEVA